MECDVSCHGDSGSEGSAVPSLPSPWQHTARILSHM